jgi:predicted transcriptional regulator
MLMQSPGRPGRVVSMATKRKTASDNPVLDPAYEAAIDEARAQVDAGKTVPYEVVRRWLMSWGTEKELERPRWK